MTLSIRAPESAGMSSERLARIGSRIRTWVDGDTIPGASMLVARRGKVVYFDQIGWLDQADGIPMRDDAIFRIHSMTKPIVCTALMTLFEEGRFQLTTPVAAFLPALAQLKVLERDNAGNLYSADLSRPITIRDLMCHTAGFTYDFLFDSPVGELYRQHGILPRGDRSLDEMVGELARLPLAFQPGTRWHYSVSIDVAAHLIQVLTDKPLRDFLRERIFSPLGMVDTDFWVPDEERARMVTMYADEEMVTSETFLPHLVEDRESVRSVRLDVEDGYPCTKPETFARGGHGLFSTTQDYARFALMLLNHGELDGERIIGRKTLELMHVNHLPPELLPWEIGGLSTPGYGFGLGSRSLMDVGAAGVLGSVGEFGWAGAASTYYWVDPQEKLVGIFMTQYQGIEEPDRRFRTLVYQAIVD